MKRLLLLLMLAPAIVSAQATTNLTGKVRDAEGRPLSSAVVGLIKGGVETTTRTDESGEFSFRNVEVGNYALTARRLGYEQYRQGIDVVVRMPTLAVTLKSTTALDTVKVRASVQAVYGAVGTSKDLHPITNAMVQIIGMNTQYNVDSAAHFFIPIKNPGSYMVRVQAPGFDPLIFSVTIPKNGGVEVAPLLDPATAQAQRMEMVLADFAERARYRNPQRSAIISHNELLADGDLSMLGAVRGAKPFMSKSLHFSDTVCIFVDGVPRPTASLQAYDPRDVEAVEAYGADVASLNQRWPKSALCSDTGMPRTNDMSRLSENTVKYVVIWLRH